MDVDLRRLRYFVAVAEELHFGRAAARLHMAQPPLSQAITKLEEELGVQLFQRTTRRVQLTGAGSTLLRHAHDLLAQVDRALDEVRLVDEGYVGRLVIGCVGSATYSVLPAVARAVRRQLPGLEVSFRGEMLAPAQQRELREGRLDLALARPPIDADLESVPLRSDPLLVAVPEGHRLASRKRVGITDLAGEELIVHAAQGSRMHHVVLGLFAAARTAPRISHEVSETSTLLTFVAAGLGVAVVPSPVASLGVPGVVHRPLAGPKADVELVAAIRRDGEPHVRRALEVVQDVVR